MPLKSKNASSIEYISYAGTSLATMSKTLLDISPYRAKFDEKRGILCQSTRYLFLKIGSPILRPRDLDSLDLAITHPSLLESTATGFFAR